MYEFFKTKGELMGRPLVF